MASGTSDGSGFGDAGQGLDGPTSFRFRRFDPLHPEHNLHLSVFPHDSNGGLRKQIEVTARRTGLEPQYVWADGPSDEQFAPRLLSTDPWDPRSVDMPEGFYAGATGHTTYSALCWKLPKRRGGQLEISYVSWRFLETADFSTSLGVKVVPPLYAKPQELAELTQAATRLLNQLGAWLKSMPPSAVSVLLRKHQAK
jgi:hypothetical protein